MTQFRSFARSFAFAIALATLSVPLLASAEETGKPSKVEKIDKKKHGKGEFPMDPVKFDEAVEKRIEKAREQMESLLAAHPLPDAMKQKIRKDFDEAAAAVRAAAKDAGKDGKVTKKEAKEVRELSHERKAELMKKYGAGKG